MPVSLRTLASGGETVGEETGAWCEERFGVRLNEFYGQTEANLLIGNCAAWPARPGRMGRAYPGHELRLVDGEIAVRVEGDPVVMLGYWRDPEATAAKVRDGWLHTGDLAEVDDEGTYRTSAAPTTSSRAAATASARVRSRSASSAIPPSPSQPRSGFPMRCAARW